MSRPEVGLLDERVTTPGETGPRTFFDAATCGRALAALTVIAVVVLWIRPIRSSLWLDETGTYWIVKDGFWSMIHRALHIQGQSPFFYAIDWVALRLGGHHEISLRLPSLLAGIGSLVMIVRVGRRLFGPEAGLIVGLVYACLFNIAFAAIDARPYMLALALSIGAVLCLVRWMEVGSKRDRALFIVLAAAMVYAHYLFGLSLVAFAAYAVSHRNRPSTRTLFLTTAWIAALCVPLAPQLVSLFNRRSELSWSNTPSPSVLLAVLGQPALLAVVGLAGRKWLGDNPDRPEASRRALGVMLVTWSIFAPLVTFAISRATAVKIFESRYYLSALPAVALMAGWALGYVRPSIVRFSVAALLAVSSVPGASVEHGNEDWAGATKYVSSTASATTPILVRSGFIEARDLPSMRDAELRSFLLAPLSFYPIAAPVVAVPYGNTAAETMWLDGFLERPLVRDARRVVVISNYNDLYSYLIEPRLEPKFHVMRRAQFGRVFVTVFDRSG